MASSTATSPAMLAASPAPAAFGWSGSGQAAVIRDKDGGMTSTSPAVPQTWTRDTIAPADWTVPLTDAAVGELIAVRDELRRAPVPVFLLDPKDFALEACRAVIAEVRRVTQSGPMFAVLDRLPMAEISRDEAIALYWLLSSLLARPV